jgi:transcriptional regulator with XRE-family HTH domain
MLIRRPDRVERTQVHDRQNPRFASSHTSPERIAIGASARCVGRSSSESGFRLPIALSCISWRRALYQCGAGTVVMSGAVSRMIDDLRERGGLKGTDVANIAAVSPATVSRWTSGTAFPHPKTQLLISDLRYVVDRLAEFYSPDETRLWLYSKHRLLNGERAIDLIHDGRTDEVLAVIEGLSEGTYT